MPDCRPRSSGERRPVRPGPGAPIMTDFADGVEQNRVVILGIRSSSRRGRALSGRGSRRADLRAAGLWPGRPPNHDGVGNGGETATATRRDRLNRRAAAAEIRLGRHDRRRSARARSGRAAASSRRGPSGSAAGVAIIDQSGIRSTARSASHGQPQRRLERGQRHLVEAQGAHQGVSLDPADRLARSRP